MNEFLNNFAQGAVEFFQSTGIIILKGILVAIVGLIVLKIIRAIIKRILFRSPLDNTISSFIFSIITALLYLFYIFIVASSFTIPMDSVLALVASIGVAIGLALKDSLSNIANGILLVTTKPFKEGDFVSINGTEGTVVGINMVTTVLQTPDNKIITIPNNSVMSANIVNYNGKNTRRLDLNFTVGYNEDIDTIKSLLLSLCTKHKMILKNPVPFIKVKEHSERGIVFLVRIWVNSDNYWTVNFDLLEQVLKEFKNNNIDIPYKPLNIKMEKDDLE